jgi:hypothetical protein
MYYVYIYMRDTQLTRFDAQYNKSYAASLPVGIPTGIPNFANFPNTRTQTVSDSPLPVFYSVCTVHTQFCEVFASRCDLLAELSLGLRLA